MYGLKLTDGALARSIVPTMSPSVMRLDFSLCTRKPDEFDRFGG